MSSLQDSYGRRFCYLRLSITEACNFRCIYCLPNGYQKLKNAPEELNLAEIQNLIQAFAELGVWKIRLTGGEPTVRKDLLEIVQAISNIAGIREVALSTNGYRLQSQARELYQAGLRSLNISMDSLDRESFNTITGRDLLPEVLNGIELACASGFNKIKINAVLLKGWNEDTILAFAAWVKERPVTVRFIELMQTALNRTVFEQHHLRSEKLEEVLARNGWKLRARSEGDGPAMEYENDHSLGRMGIIAPYGTGFCSSCNRLRVSSQGGLRLCLFGEGNHSLRPLLQSESQKDELKKLIINLLYKKDATHYLPEGRYGDNQGFSTMGG